MDIELIKELISCFESTKLQKISVKNDGFEISLEKDCFNAARPMVYENHAHMVPPSPSNLEKKQEEMGVFITSPMVGTFYAAAAPNQPNFVKIGDRVSKGTTVAIVEAMKVMNEVKADQAGVIAEVLIHNGQAVEFGSKLFRIVNA